MSCQYCGTDLERDHHQIDGLFCRAIQCKNLRAENARLREDMDEANAVIKVQSSGLVELTAELEQARAARNDGMFLTEQERKP